MSNRPPLFWILVVLGVLAILFGVEHQLTHMTHVSLKTAATVVAGIGLIFWATRLQRSEAESGEGEGGPGE